MENAAHWNLRKMYATDDAWRSALQEVQGLIAQLIAQRGHAAATAADLLQTMRLQDAVNLKMEDLYVFAHSNYDQDMSNAPAKELFESAQNALTELGEQTAFLSPELMQSDLETFNRFCAELPELEMYRRELTDFFSKKAHILSDEMETALVRMNDLGESFEKIFEDLTINDMRFPTIETPDGQTEQVTEAAYGAALSNPDRAYRARYWKGLLSTYGAHIHTIASCYYGSVKNDLFTAKTRRYTSSRAMGLSNNFIPEEVYDQLVTTVRENVAPLHDYVELRRRLLNVDQVHFYDLFVPTVPETDRKYTYEEAQQLVLAATAVLGEDYTALVQRAFDERWIDVYPGPNKRTGAYSTGSYHSDPYILLNFNGTLDDVFTLAHEMGHSLHSWFSNHAQPPVDAGYSIFCAEVASTTNEQLLSAYLYDHAQTDAERADLLDKRLTDIRSTFYRQTMFADFEHTTHLWAESGKPLLPENLCGLHRDLNRLYYGDQFAIDDELQYEWARIPHFYRAFYVYQYATGISAAVAIARRILTQGAPAVADYRKFLCGGGSAHPIELLKLAGVNMASQQPVLDTVAEFRTTLAQLRQLLGQ